MSFSFSLDPSRLERHGHDLYRPENVLCFRDGTVFASSDQGFVTRIDPDGRQENIGSIPGAAPTTMALAEDEKGLIVNDTADGKVYRLGFDGSYELYLGEIDGRPLGSANYVFRDRRDRLWIAVATRSEPPHEFLDIVADGYIVVVEDGEARIVADGLLFPNEVRLDAREEWAYVPETTGRRVLRLPVTADGGLGEAEVFGPDCLGETVLPDGIALDVEGNVWVAAPTHNGLMLIDKDGNAGTVFEEPDPAGLEALAAAFGTGRIPRSVFPTCVGPELKLLTSVGFLGEDLRTVVMGSLAMKQLVKFRAPVAGLPLVHQDRDTAPQR
jgi:sugar lactone lactonase YvrE